MPRKPPDPKTLSHPPDPKLPNVMLVITRDRRRRRRAGRGQPLQAPGSQQVQYQCVPFEDARRKRQRATPVGIRCCRLARHRPEKAQLCLCLEIAPPGRLQKNRPAALPQPAAALRLRSLQTAAATRQAGAHLPLRQLPQLPGRYLLLEGFCARVANRLVAVGHQQKRRIADTYKLKPNHIQTIYNGVEPIGTRVPAQHIGDATLAGRLWWAPFAPSSNRRGSATYSRSQRK